MTLDEALYYIHSVCWKGSVPGLERISALLDKMGHPERKLKFIHVTGTNGKTTTVTLLGEIFRNAGRTTHVVGNIGYPYSAAGLDSQDGDCLLYTSPSPRDS